MTLRAVLASLYDAKDRRRDAGFDSPTTIKCGVANI